jgi:hypothetical protein
MKAFHTIAIPHKDILEGRLTMDVFAADLWAVSQKSGPAEYKYADTFFSKTYLTQGLSNLLDVVKKRLDGKGGDPVIQLQTPFGGGKTHSLIAMYHKSKEWKVKPTVIVGTSLPASTTLWSLLEIQLAGKVNKMKGNSAPGKIALKELLLQHQPLIILIDELLEYVTKAAVEKVGGSTLGAQTIAFMQELTEIVSELDKSVLVVTLPSSIIEHYDEQAEKLYMQLKKVSGRKEIIYTPVEENEITKIIRQRLFQEINENNSKKIVNDFVKYAEKENILPNGSETNEYKEKFLASYPFLPEVVDFLYTRWGTFSTFQRTRGVLRLLSLVIHSLSKSPIPYISLADFNLSIQEIRQELLKHIETTFNGIIAVDITNKDSGAHRVDKNLGRAYVGLNLGHRIASSIFMSSFSGGQVRGATLNEIKRFATTLDNPAAVIGDALSQLEKSLFFLHVKDDKYYFDNQPNLTKILFNKMENVKDDELKELELKLLRGSISGSKFKTYIWEEASSNIPDTEDLKLIIHQRENKNTILEIIKNKGLSPRVYRNTLFFLYPLESERYGFLTTLRRKIAYEKIEEDKTLNLSEDQKRDIKKEIKKLEGNLKEYIRRLYRVIAIPNKEGIKEPEDLGTPIHGDTVELDYAIYEHLRGKEILESMPPIVIKTKYLTNKDYVPTENLYLAALKTPGEVRPISKLVIEHGIQEGCKQGIFGIGELIDDKPVCRYFKQYPSLSFSGNEILITDKICLEQEKEKAETAGATQFQFPEDESKKVESGVKNGASATPLTAEYLESISLNLNIPKGKIANLMGILNYLQSKFNVLELEIKVRDGKITEQEFEDKIKEALAMSGIRIKE